MIKICSYNCNSINLRLDVIERLYNEGVDIICLQETKVRDDKFPVLQINEIGYENLIYHGDGGQYGVAVLSKHKIEEVKRFDIVGSGKRHIHFTINGVNVHNFYIPAGGDLPDTENNPKFKQKMEYLTYIIDYFAAPENNFNTILMGDLNIAPLEHDVYNHKKLLREVSHSPLEIETMARWIKSGNFIDIARHFVPESEKLYSWWSYRVKDSYNKNYGRRLDHIWCTVDLASKIGTFQILPQYRILPRPSDHVPLVCEFDI